MLNKIILKNFRSEPPPSVDCPIFLFLSRFRHETRLRRVAVCLRTQYGLEETVLPPCEWRWTVSCHLNSSSLASRGPSADFRAGWHCSYKLLSLKLYERVHSGKRIRLLFMPTVIRLGQVRQSCSAFNCLSSGINILAGGRPFPWNLASKWPALSCQWYPMGDVRTHNSRTDSRRIFKLRGGVDRVTRHVWPLTKVKRSQGHVRYQQQ